MTILKLFSTLFSNVKTIKKAIQRSKTGDHIKLSPKIYKESIHFERDVLISANGNDSEETIIEGVIIVPKTVQVTIQNVTISPTSQIYVEGNLKLENCRLIGKKSEVLLSANGGVIQATNCELTNAKEVAVALMNQSNSFFKNCIFNSNGKMQILLQDSEANVEDCEFTNSQHCFWIKNNSKLYATKSHLHHHHGTQIIVDGAKFEDFGSIIEHGEGNGIYGLNEAEITFQNSTIRYHSLPQVWVQESVLKTNHCIINYGEESGITLKNNAEAMIYFCEISNHKKENILVKRNSRINLEQCHIHSGSGVGIQIKSQSIANFNETIIKSHGLSQIYITDQSICSMKSCMIKDGYHIGLFVDKKSCLSVVKSEISKHANSAFTSIEAQLNVYECKVMDNKGNGILAIEKSNVDIELSTFHDNDMPHLACKSNVITTITQCDFFNGKSIFIVKHSEVFVFESKFHHCDQVQIEITDHSTAVFDNSSITNGSSYGIKITRNSISNFINCQISNHNLAQMVVNDSSLIINNCELIEGNRNGLLIQNHSEVFIRDSYIAKHMKPQIWIDFESTVDLESVQITEGFQSDLLAQNRSAIYVSDSIIRNDRYRYNVQAMNHSKIKFNKTIIENKCGEVFYSENNSLITNSIDEMD